MNPPYSCIALLLLLLSGCKGQSGINLSSDLEISEAHFIKDQEDSFRIRILCHGIIEMAELYYDHHWQTASVEEKGLYTMIAASFDSRKRDRIMHADSRKEVGNQPPGLLLKTYRHPEFKTGPGEAVLYYSLGGSEPRYQLIQLQPTRYP